MHLGLFPAAVARPLILAAMLLCMASPAWAHRLLLFPAISSEVIVIHASFGRNSPAVGAQVRVYAEDGQLLHEGQSDESGRFRFPTPPAQELRIVVDDGAGHRQESVISRQRLQEVAAKNSSSTSEATEAAEPPEAPAEAVDTSEVNQRLNDLELRLSQLEQQASSNELWRFAAGLLTLLLLAALGMWWSQRQSQRQSR